MSSPRGSADPRQRLLSAVAVALAERGYPALDVDQVLVIAGTSREEFDRNFGDLRGCVLAAQEQALGRLAGELVAACSAQRSWPAKLVAAIRAGVEFASRAPEEARLLLLDAVAMDPILAGQVLEANDLFVDLLRRGRAEYPAAAALPELTEQAMVGAAVAVIGGKLMTGQSAHLHEVEPALVQLMLLPYVGSETAARMATAIRGPTA